MVTIIVFAPLLGAILCGFGYKWLGEQAAMVTATGLLFLAFLLSLDRVLHLRRPDRERVAVPLDLVAAR